MLDYGLLRFARNDSADSPLRYFVRNRGNLSSRINKTMELQIARF